VGIGKSWDLMLELGTNSNADRVAVFSAAWRF
jgi:hypothetical protein